MNLVERRRPRPAIGTLSKDSVPRSHCHMGSTSGREQRGSFGSSGPTMEPSMWRALSEDSGRTRSFDCREGIHVRVVLGVKSQGHVSGYLPFIDCQLAVTRISGSTSMLSSASSSASDGSSASSISSAPIDAASRDVIRSIGSGCLATGCHFPIPRRDTI